MLKEINHIVKQPEHHAYIIFTEINPKEVTTEKSQDFHVIRSEKNLTVEEARTLQDYAIQSINGESRKVLLETQDITPQAQNALLKIIEEVRHGVHFFIFLPPGTTILETLLSRCYIIENTESTTTEPSEEFKQFIKSPPKKRLTMIDAIWEKENTKRHTEILRLLQNIEKHIHQQIAEEKTREHTNRCRKVANNLRNAVRQGALHKGTVQALAFV